jgi:hypothetical protein
LLLADPASAQTYYVAPLPTGSDKNNCETQAKPCATFQHAANKCPAGGYCKIALRPGTYSQKTNIIYYKVIAIVGPIDKDGNCIDRNAIVIDDRVNGVGERGAIFQVQDHAILALSCLTLASYSKGSVGFTARQFAIGDVNDVDFLQFSGGINISAGETSKVNVASPGIRGDAFHFAAANELSQITIGGIVMVADELHFGGAFLASTYHSIIRFYPSEMVGGNKFTGQSYQCNDAVIEKNVTLPGEDSPYEGNQNCDPVGFSAASVLPDRIDKLRVELNNALNNTLGSNLEIIRTDLNNLNNRLHEINKDLTELTAQTEAQIGALAHDQRQTEAQIGALAHDQQRHWHRDRIRDVIIAGLALLIVFALSMTGYLSWRVRRSSSRQ